MSDKHHLQPVSMNADPVYVEINRYQVRERNDPGWRASPALVYAAVGHEGVELLPHEARWLARQLLAAADMADGVTTTW